MWISLYLFNIMVLVLGHLQKKLCIFVFHTGYLRAVTCTICYQVSLLKNVILRFWNVNINFSCVSIRRRTLCWEVVSFYEVWILKTKRLSTDKSLSGRAFCGVRLYFICVSATMNFTRISYSTSLVQQVNIW